MKRAIGLARASAGSPLAQRPGRDPPRLAAVSLAAGGWGLLYALYRGYYGLGGTAGMVGEPVSQAQWRAINLAGAAVLLAAAVLPLAMLPLWRRPRLRPLLLAVCWAVAVGCVMHGLIDDTQRVLSLSGVLRVGYPSAMWATLDRHAADVQDLAFNETWFLIEGLLWGGLAWLNLGRSPARAWWTSTGVAAVAVLTATGLLSAFGVIGKIVLG